ncbi:hypothetical protein BHM03_00030960 [Ensete ventricosum]|nr:hypothetical protein BHM03_00030960 [Ensete ventricosum]
MLSPNSSSQHPTGIIVHPSGVVRSLPESIDAFAPCYGDQQGKRFRVWVDRVCSSRMGSDAWLVKFHKWELSGMIIFIREQKRRAALLPHIDSVERKGDLPTATSLFLFSCEIKTLLIDLAFFWQPEAPEEFALVRVHQTWLDGYAAKDQPAFIF